MTPHAEPRCSRSRRRPWARWPPCCSRIAGCSMRAISFFSSRSPNDVDRNSGTLLLASIDRNAGKPRKRLSSEELLLPAALTSGGPVCVLRSSHGFVANTHLCLGSGRDSRPPSKPINAPAVIVKTCSQALKRRSRAFGSGSTSIAVQTITPSVTTHNTELIHNSRENIGLTVMTRARSPWPCQIPSPPRDMRPCAQVNDRCTERVTEGAPRNENHGPDEPPWTIVKQFRLHLCLHGWRWIDVCSLFFLYSHFGQLSHPKPLILFQSTWATNRSQQHLLITCTANISIGAVPANGKNAAFLIGWRSWRKR